MELSLAGWLTAWSGFLKLSTTRQGGGPGFDFGDSFCWLWVLWELRLGDYILQ